ncbi:MAG: hypothetical protein ACQSGP_23055, partial [Frankia sp.]
MHKIVTDTDPSEGDALGLAVPGVEVLIAAVDPPAWSDAGRSAGARWYSSCAEAATALRDALVERCGVDERCIRLL